MTIWAILYLIMQSAGLVYILTKQGKEAFVGAVILWLPTLFFLFMGGFFG